MRHSSSLPSPNASRPKGRGAKRMSFYALNRRKARGRSVLRQIRAVLGAVASFAIPVVSNPVGAVPVSVVRDEWDGPDFRAFRAGACVK